MQTCDWCGAVHPVAQLCHARPRWSRRGFVALLGLGLVGALVPGHAEPKLLTFAESLAKTHRDISGTWTMAAAQMTASEQQQWMAAHGIVSRPSRGRLWDTEWYQMEPITPSPLLYVMTPDGLKVMERA